MQDQTHRPSSNAEAIRCLAAVRERPGSAQSHSTSVSGSYGNLLRSGSIKPSYLIKRKPDVDQVPETSHDDFGAIRDVHYEGYAYAYDPDPLLKTTHLRSAVITNQRENSDSDHNVLSYIQTKALGIFKRKLRSKASRPQRQQHKARHGTKPDGKPVPIAKKVKSFVSL